MSYYLFLDDWRRPETTRHIQLPAADWVIVRSYNEFVSTILSRWNGAGDLPICVSLDHDLSERAQAHCIANKGETFDYSLFEDEKTGFHAAKFLVDFLREHDLDLPQCYIHSMNPIGGENILKVLQDYDTQRLSAKKRLED